MLTGCAVTTINDGEPVVADYTDIDKLRELAEAATPGPWKWSVSVDRQWALVETAEDNLRILAQLPDDDDAAFIAAASPDVILALVAELVGLRAEVDQLRPERNEWRNTAFAARDHYEQSDARLAVSEAASEAEIIRLTAVVRRVEALRDAWATGEGEELLLSPVQELSQALAAAVPVVGAEEPNKQSRSARRVFVATSRSGTTA